MTRGTPAYVLNNGSLVTCITATKNTNHARSKMMMIRVVLYSSLLTLLTLRGNLKLNPVALRKHIRLRFDNYASKMKTIAIYWICYVTLQSENMIKIKFSENKSYIIKEIWMRINFTAYLIHDVLLCVIYCGSCLKILWLRSYW